MQYNRVTVQRAMLHLHALAVPSSTERLAVHGISDSLGWNEATDPGKFGLVGTTDAVLVTDALTDSLTLRLEAGSTVRSWRARFARGYPQERNRRPQHAGADRPHELLRLTPRGSRLAAALAGSGLYPSARSPLGNRRWKMSALQIGRGRRGETLAE